MDIIKENINELNAVLKVKLGPEDYQEKVDIALKDYQKKANLPGFRPGKVPVGMIKKMYGKSILVDQINKLLSDSLYKYLSESQLEVLGNPLPKMDEHQTIDWNNQKDFEFLYDLGLAPKFSLELSKKDKFLFKTPIVDDSLVSKSMIDISKRYGNMISPEISQDEDVLFGDFVEMAVDDTIVPGGLFKASSIAIERIKNEILKNKLIGLKKADKIIFENSIIMENQLEIAVMVGLEKDKIENFKSNIQFTLNNISRVQAAELNQEFFDKIYGKEKVNSIEEFKSKIREDLSIMFIDDSDKILYNDIVESLMNKINIALPDEFLKRWLIAANEKTITMEQVNSEYGQYSKGLKWQLIENKIIKDFRISVTKEVLINHVKGLIQEQYARYNSALMEEDELKKTVDKILAKKEEVKKLYEKLYHTKLMDLFKNTFTIENKEIAYDEFYNFRNSSI